MSRRGGPKRPKKNGLKKATVNAQVVATEKGRQPLVTIEATRISSGPLPPAEELQKYANVFEGCADRIVAMAENNQAHRHSLETKVIGANISREKWGQLIAASLFLAVAGGGVWLISIDKPVEGFTSLLLGLAGPIGLLVYGRGIKREELEEKRPES